MENTPRPSIDPKLIQELVAAAEQATDAMSTSINLDWAAGNEGCDDVKELDAAFVQLSDALKKIESAGCSS